MTTITREFTYKIADDIYSQTDLNQSTATATYVGPEKKYAIVSKLTNKFTGATITEEQHATYNTIEDNEDFYSVELDANTSLVLVCAMLDGGINPIGLPTVSEDIPGQEAPFVRTEPVLPSDTYTLTEIKWDITTSNIVYPLPWAAEPNGGWDNLIKYRNTKLAASDRTLTDDMPTDLYNEVLAYKQYLRDFPVTMGASWDVTVATAGANYTVGDRFLISDPVYKNGTAADDIMIKVTSVDEGTGAITGISKGNATAYNYHPSAGTYNDVFNVPSASGTGATFNMTKVATVPAGKVQPKEHPFI